MLSALLLMAGMVVVVSALMWFGAISFTDVALVCGGGGVGHGGRACVVIIVYFGLKKKSIVIVAVDSL